MSAPKPNTCFRCGIPVTRKALCCKKHQGWTRTAKANLKGFQS